MQEKMLEIFKDLRPNPEYPVYPPYHQGLYLEDYFCDWFYKNDINVDRQYIPVSWTTCYVDKKREDLQSTLDSLDQNKSYFTVAQHDDAIEENLPPDTLCFNAGGNRGGIPLPLICSKMPSPTIDHTHKPILASFVGSLTHPVRIAMYQALVNKPDCVMEMKQWSPEVHEQDFHNFVHMAMQSKFLLCPRGYGLNSFRLYEALQLGCVPVIITDKFFLPWDDELDWSEFSVLIDMNNLENIHFILENINEVDYNNMLDKGKQLYEDYFSLEGVCKNIIKRIT